MSKVRNRPLLRDDGKPKSNFKFNPLFGNHRSWLTSANQSPAGKMQTSRYIYMYYRTSQYAISELHLVFTYIYRYIWPQHQLDNKLDIVAGSRTVILRRISAPLRFSVLRFSCVCNMFSRAHTHFVFIWRKGCSTQNVHLDALCENAIHTLHMLCSSRLARGVERDRLLYMRRRCPYNPARQQKEFSWPAKSRRGRISHNSLRDDWASTFLLWFVQCGFSCAITLYIVNMRCAIKSRNIIPSSSWS